MSVEGLATDVYRETMLALFGLTKMGRCGLARVEILSAKEPLQVAWHTMRFRLD